MKRRHRAKSDILIDLTSLLDVIFIVLLVVIARQQTLTEKQQEQVNAGVAVEEARAQEG
jgi:biopolymer transport protein ExbD